MDCCDHDHCHTADETTQDKENRGTLYFLKPYIPSIISFVLLLVCLVFDNFIKPNWFENYIRLAAYFIAYIPVAIPVIRAAHRAVLKKDIFSEFTLMIMATGGAFYIGEYPEAVAVMLFYSVGELFQSAAVRKAKGDIKALLDLRPESAFVVTKGEVIERAPDQVQIGEIIQVRSGERVPLDGELQSDLAVLNAAALTGESLPVEMAQTGQILSGMINEGPVILIKVSKAYSDSSLSRILNMVENAASQKAPTELFIRKFARIYTPIVVALATAIILIPMLVVETYVFEDWLYRAMIFLVISCPCALVISIPLGYFGGIGAASKKGVLFKGSNYLDALTKVDTLVMDKTGTITKGNFVVDSVRSDLMDDQKFLALVASVEKYSTHPIAQAIVRASSEKSEIDTREVNEIAGHGIQAILDGKTILVGNTKLLKASHISYPEEIDDIIESIVVVAIDKKFAGYITVVDQIKEDAAATILELKNRNITPIILSGDKQSIVTKVAGKIGVQEAFGDLLPQDKLNFVKKMKEDPSMVIAFVGDGINDAPVLAISDVGMAMGAMGSDVAIETADVVIQTDHLSKINKAIDISHSTKKVVIQNITLAFGVKAVVLIMGAFGLATMWAAVFADVGVALLAILNAVRVQTMK